MIVNTLKKIEDNINLICCGLANDDIYNETYNFLEEIINEIYYKQYEIKKKYVYDAKIELVAILRDIQNKKFNLTRDIMEEIVNEFNFIDSEIKKGIH